MALPYTLPTRTSEDANSASDVNALMSNDAYLEAGKLDIEKASQTITGDIVIDGDLEVTGTIAYKPGQIIEYLTSPCDGSTVSGISGDYTWPTVSGVQSLTTTAEDVTGSSISYTPPTGATKVKYIFNFTISGYDENPIGHYQFYVDGNEVVYARFPSRYMRESRVQFEWVINIGGTADANVGRIETWTTAKILKMMARDYSTTYDVKLHETYYWNGGASSQFSMPVLTIIAIA